MLVLFNLCLLIWFNFFGSALGCSDGTIGNYSGLSLKEAHANMNVTQAAFDTFNGALMGILKPFLSSADYTTVYGVLNSTHSDVCTASDCGTATTATTATGTTATTATTATGTTATTATTATGTTATTATTDTSATSATTSTTSSSATPAPSSSTGFGLVLAPVFAMFTVFLF